MPLTPRDGLAILSAALAALALGAAAFFMLSSGGASPAPAGQESSPMASWSVAVAAGGSPAADAALLVDVQGGVRHPGLVRLASDARVADAISAAGGYSDQADLLAAAAAVNLAAPLSDGQQVFVPLQGVAGVGAGAGADGGSGLVNLNTASADQLDALPGIGPVTVEKILAARLEQPFATLDELVDRKVLNRGQLDDIRDQVTV